MHYTLLLNINSILILKYILNIYISTLFTLRSFSLSILRFTLIGFIHTDITSKTHPRLHGVFELE